MHPGLMHWQGLCLSLELDFELCCAAPHPPTPPPLVLQVQYLDKTHTFTAEQLMAMLLVDLKEVAEADGVAVSEAVLSVPTYYTEPERHAMLAAAQVGRGAGGVPAGWQGRQSKQCTALRVFFTCRVANQQPGLPAGSTGCRCPAPRCTAALLRLLCPLPPSWPPG